MSSLIDNSNKTNEIDVTMKKVYLEVPYEYKDYVKSNNAKWDNEIKRWYCQMTSEELKSDLHIFDRFRIVYFDCPIRLKDKVKELGAKFLRSEKKPLTYRGNYELLKLLKKNPKQYESILTTKKQEDIFINDSN